MKNRKIGQKISFFFAVSCYLMAVATAVFGAYWWNSNGSESPIFASAISSFIFFISCGIVLHFMANANNLMDLKIKSDDAAKPDNQESV